MALSYRSAAEKCPGITYWDYNWRKGGGSARMIEINKRKNFYQQDYCGCAYPLRHANQLRRAAGREPIKLGVFYGGASASGVPTSDS